MENWLITVQLPNVVHHFRLFVPSTSTLKDAITKHLGHTNYIILKSIPLTNKWASCEGCKTNQPNQLAHMDQKGGCLFLEEQKDENDENDT